MTSLLHTHAVICVWSALSPVVREICFLGLTIQFQGFFVFVFFVYGGGACVFFWLHARPGARQADLLEVGERHA